MKYYDIKDLIFLSAHLAALERKATHQGRSLTLHFEFGLLNASCLKQYDEKHLGLHVDLWHLSGAPPFLAFLLEL
jgi:hypothetical protein